jgi:hypothetical protein
MEEGHEQGTDRRSGGTRDKGKHNSKYHVRQVLGKTEELQDNVYTLTPNGQADAFITTTKAIAEHVGVIYGWDLRILVKHRIEAFTKPTLPTVAAAIAQMAEFKAEFGIYHTKLQEYDNKGKVFVIILGQCTVEVMNWLEQGRGLDRQATRDVVGLLKLLEDGFLKRRRSGSIPDRDLEFEKARMIQQGSKEHAKYYQRLRTAADVLIGQWGDSYPSKLVNTSTSKEEASDRLLASIFLHGSDKTRFGSLQEELNNAYVGGSDRYPKTFEDTQRLLCKQHEDHRLLPDFMTMRSDGDASSHSKANQVRHTTTRQVEETRQSRPLVRTRNLKKTDNKLGTKARKRSSSPAHWAESDMSTRYLFFKRNPHIECIPSYVSISNIEEVCWTDRLGTGWVLDTLQGIQWLSSYMALLLVS